MDIHEVWKYLPHRYPFLMIDRIIDFKHDESITCIKNVTINEDFFNGHFPNHPVMPGVLILEAMAQAGGILGFKTKGQSPEQGFVYYFAGSDKVRFKRPVVPGDQLTLIAKKITERRGMWKFECKALVGENVVCSAEITCVEKDISL